jgi:hypothetical protein
MFTNKIETRTGIKLNARTARHVDMNDHIYVFVRLIHCHKKATTIVVVCSNLGYSHYFHDNLRGLGCTLHFSLSCTLSDCATCTFWYYVGTIMKVSSLWLFLFLVKSSKADSIEIVRSLS